MNIAFEELIEHYVQAGLMLTTAESCTGGMIAAAITDIAGSSAIFDRGFVTYSNEAKTEMLGVPAALIAQHGAVSEEVARAMAQGALTHSRANFAISTTGIAGPSGGSAEKPVGTVYIGQCRKGEAPTATLRHFSGDRAAIRAQTVQAALKILEQMIETPAQAGVQP